MTKEELLTFFIEVGRVLTDEGILTFDASLEKNSVKNVKHLNRKGKCDGIRYKQESKYYAMDTVHKNKFILELPGGQIYEEEHMQKIFHFTDYFEVIEKANLYVSDCFDFFTFQNATESCERVQFVIRKQNKC
jgi:hypothetical protein